MNDREPAHCGQCHRQEHGEPEDCDRSVVELAKAQPFEDGNKRTVLFVANSLPIGDPGCWSFL